MVAVEALVLLEFRKFFPMILKSGVDIEGCRSHETTRNKSYPKHEMLGFGLCSEDFLNGQGRAH